MTKKWVWIIILGITAGCNSKPFQNLKGEQVNIEINKNTKAIIYIFLVPDCPLSQYYTMAVNQVYSVFQQKGFQFYGIVPGNLYSFPELDSFKTQYKFLPEILIDKNYNLSKKYKVTVVPQVVVTDMEGRVLYEGKIDNTAIRPGLKKYQPSEFYLLEALKNLYDGHQIIIKKTIATGCYIE